ncbi:mucin-3A-like [Sphaeramia orbicularis]|uniref:mucin-3A-like n=1 Tax=Sphaeramia orbicularis TaxID=375764 RepID=UPI0011802FBE|nr:mucin-3A-like [Sphaeramia orbicularis]
MEYHSGGSLPLLGRPRYCPGANANGGYLCETGHCCGETGCCTYYYELWWFWLLWTVLILFSCCCAYRHRRAKLRVQQQQRQREISLLAYHGANSYPSSMLDLSFLASLKLPSYEEVAAQPSTPPPPYSSVFTTPRYPQPPRAADPHLLTQHGPLLHRPLSDGPSSLSSDNSSSCSCDSCCPSSPCSSSLSAPVTYETDTSHASTPSEAAPLALDVTMETISAAASRLEANETRFASERTTAAVAVDIGDAAEEQEPVATDSSVPKQTVTVAVITRSASPQHLTSPGSEVALSVGITSPVKQQLDPAPCTPNISTCSPSTSPTYINTVLPSVQISTTEGPAAFIPKSTSKSNPSTPTASMCDSPPPTQTLHLTRTFDTANSPTSPTSASSPDVDRTLILDPGTVPFSDLNPSLLLISASSGPDTVPTKVIQGPEEVPSVLTQISDTVPILTQVLETAPTNLAQSPVLTQTHLSLTQTTNSECKSLTQAPDPVLTKLTQAQDSVPSVLSQTPDTAPTDFTQTLQPVSTSLVQTPVPTPSHLQLTETTNPEPKNLLQAPAPTNLTTFLVPEAAPDPINPVLSPKPTLSNLTLASDAGLFSPTAVQCQKPELSPGPGLAMGPPSPQSGLPKHAEPNGVFISCPDPTAAPIDSGPSMALSQPPDLVSLLVSDNLADLRSGVDVGSRSSLMTSPVLTVPTSSSSTCPAITIQADSSFATSGDLSPTSPSSIPSPSLPSPSTLLDPLSALHQTEKSGSSSGHASSLSPSPRNTQSPPKQTLFSPCVDVFEPVPPNWEDDEDDQAEDDNDDEEDDDMGADESQYRHRRLTGDSGIEVCRCRVEEEDEDDEDEEEEEGEKKENGRRGGVVGGERDKKGGGNADLHDSVDCPARGQMSTGEELTLCNPTSTTTPTSDDSGKVVIVMETV